MFDLHTNIDSDAVGLITESGRTLERVETLHPLDDKAVWAKSPAYNPPADVDIVQTQKWIDSIMGTTRDNESIYKLVWNGDRNYWYEFFWQWDGLGRPIGAPVKCPRVRFGVRLGPNGRKDLDVFPPRWLILTRLEPEQYAENWAAESWVSAPEINGKKLIRPETPPKVFWLWYMTIAEHSGHCCASAHKRQEKCYGKYASPQAARSILEQQREADKKAGARPFDTVHSSVLTEIEEDNNGYRRELDNLRIESEIYLENPMALLGLPAMEAGVSLKQGRQIVADALKRQSEELSRLV